MCNNKCVSVCMFEIWDIKDYCYCMRGDNPTQKESSVLLPRIVPKYCQPEAPCKRTLKQDTVVGDVVLSFQQFFVIVVCYKYTISEKVSDAKANCFESLKRFVWTESCYISVSLTHPHTIKCTIKSVSLPFGVTSINQTISVEVLTIVEWGNGD